MRTVLLNFAWIGILIGDTALLVESYRHRWPGLHIDAMLFATLPANDLTGREGHFSVYGSQILAYQIADGTEHPPFNFHGQLFQRIVALVAPTSDMPGVVDAIGRINIATIIAVWLFVFLHAVLRWNWTKSASGFIATLVANGGIGVLFWLQGRPEQMIPLTVSVFGILRLIGTSRKWNWFVHVVEAATIASLSPVPGGWMVFFRSFEIVTAKRGMRLVGELLLFSLMVLIVWIVMTRIVSPYSPFQIIVQTIHVSIGYGLGPPRSFHLIPCYWFYHSSFPLLGAMFWTAALTGILVVRSRIATVSQRVMLLLLSVPFALLIFQSAFQHPGTLYRVYAFYPLAFVAGIEFIMILQQSMNERYKWIQWTRYFIIFCVVVMGFATIRYALLLDWHLASGTTFERAKQIVVQLKQNLQPNERIAFSEYFAPSLVVFDDPPNWQMIGVEHETHEELELIPRLYGTKFPYLLVVQKSFSPPPISYGKYELIDSQWNQTVPTCFGFPLAEYCPGYQFATYRLHESK